MRRFIYFLRSLQWVSIIASVLGLTAIVYSGIVAYHTEDATPLTIALSANAILYGLLAIRSE